MNYCFLKYNNEVLKLIESSLFYENNCFFGNLNENYEIIKVLLSVSFCENRLGYFSIVCLHWKNDFSNISQENQALN